MTILMRYATPVLSRFDKIVPNHLHTMTLTLFIKEGPNAISTYAKNSTLCFSYF